MTDTALHLLLAVLALLGIGVGLAAARARRRGDLRRRHRLRLLPALFVACAVLNTRYLTYGSACLSVSAAWRSAVPGRMHLFWRHMVGAGMPLRADDLVCTPGQSRGLSNLG